MTSVALSQLFFFGGSQRRPQWAPRKLLSSGAYSKIPFLDRVYLRAHTVWWPAEVSSWKRLLEPRSILTSGCHTSCVIRQLATRLPDSLTHITYLIIFSVSSKRNRLNWDNVFLTKISICKYPICVSPSTFFVRTRKGKDELLLQTIYTPYILMIIPKNVMLVNCLFYLMRKIGRELFPGTCCMKQIPDTATTTVALQQSVPICIYRLSLFICS